MEDKVISFGKGIHREPSVGAVGELSDCVNLYSDGAEMKMMPRMETVSGVPKFTNCSVLAKYIHKPNDEQHLIMLVSGTTSKVKEWKTITDWSELKVGDQVRLVLIGTSSTEFVDIETITKNEDDPDNPYYKITVEIHGKSLPFYSNDSSIEVQKSVEVTLVEDAIAYSKMDDSTDTTPTIIKYLSEDETLNEISSMGNVLLVSTSEKMYYFLWANGYYADYSLDEIGDLQIQFKLRGTYETMGGNGIGITTMVGTDVSSAEYENVETVTLPYFSSENREWVEITHDIVKGKKYSLTFNNKTSEVNLAYVIASKDEISSKLSGVMWSFDGTAIYSLADDYGYHVLADMFAPSNGERTDSFEAEDNYSHIYCIGQSDGYNTIGLGEAVENPESVDCKYVVRKDSEDTITTLQGNIAQFIKERATVKNKFMMPFFARAAIQLVDGTYIQPTAPVLMCPNSGVVPHCYIKENLEDLKVGDKKSPTMSAVCSILQYNILNSSALTRLKALGDIVKGITIAVTAPIYRYNAGASTEEINKCLYLKPIDKEGLGVSVSSTQLVGYVDFGEYYKYDLDKKYGNEGIYNILLPEKDIDEEIENASVFRVIKNISLDELTANTDCDVLMDTGTLLGLDGRQTLTDNSLSLRSFNADTIYSYNSRLTIGNYMSTYFKGHEFALMNGYSSKKRNIAPEQADDYTIEIESSYAIVTLSVNNKKYNCITYSTISNYSTPSWLYYPSSNAKSIQVFVNYKIGDVQYYKKRLFNLEEHKYLDGAYWFGGLGSDCDTIVQWDSISSAEYNVSSNETPTITIQNGVLSSIVNNPFVLDAESSSLVGMGSVKKLLSNTKALSQGQFGQHPVLAFCTDGIWALAVGSDGTYTAIQPISRDVVNNVDSITQTDNNIVFTTDKGLMLLDGSETKQLCKHMDNRDMFDLSKLADFYSGYFIDDSTTLFTDMLKKCKIIYDYVHQLLWIYPNMSLSVDSGEIKGAVRQYAVSLTTGEVFSYIDNNYESGIYSSSLLQGPQSIVVDYPYSYAQFYTQHRKDPRVDPKVITTYGLYAYMINTEDDETVKKGYLLTRPIPFDDAFTMKMLYDMKVEKMFSAGSSAKVAVYVSNDRVNWARLKSLKARSYKWYRFAVFCNMNDYDRLTGILCRIQTRRANKIR